MPESNQPQTPWHLWFIVAGFALSTFAYAETKAPDNVVTKDDINKCLKHLRKTEDFLYPHSLKVESAHYTQEDKKYSINLKHKRKD